MKSRDNNPKQDGGRKRKQSSGRRWMETGGTTVRSGTHFQLRQSPTHHLTNELKSHCTCPTAGPSSACTCPLQLQPVIQSQGAPNLSISRGWTLMVYKKHTNVLSSKSEMFILHSECQYGGIIKHEYQHNLVLRLLDTTASGL